MNQHVSLEDKITYTGVGGAPGLETFPDPPTIRLAEETSDLYARFAARAVQLINSALPYEKRITLGTEPLPEATVFNDVPEGEILLKFGSITNRRTLGTAGLLSSYYIDPNTNEQKVQKALRARITINDREMRKAEVYNPELDNDYAGENWESKILDSRVENSDTIIKWVNDEIFLSVVVHEIMHALGFYHIDESRFSNSVMHSKVTAERDQVNEYTPYLDSPTIIMTFSVTHEGTTDVVSDEEATNEPERNIEVDEETTAQSNPDKSKQGYLITPKARTVPGHILFPLDRAALLAAYGRLAPGAQPEELTAENLGSWSDTSFHLRGDVDFPGGRASFGVASSNGLIQPWASGTTPWTNLEDNNNLSGSATWNGALLGIASSSETVAGDASLSVNLASLTGQLDFTGMEKWEANVAPGAAGSGAAWGDGDLGYTIEVRGNTFIQTGGDDGYVTGAFFGAAHEAMGGVLERADLSAGFGGKR